MTDRNELDPLFLLLSWFSPNYPVGGYAYSHGLEHAVEAAEVTDGPCLREWIATVLLHGSGRVDGVLFREVHRAILSSDHERLNELAELSVALQATAELALESRAQGEAFLTATRSAWPADELEWLSEPAPAFSIAVAVACAAHGIGLRSGLLAWYHAFASNLVSAGIRLVPLGQSEGQRTLAALASTVRDATRQAESLSMDDLGTAAPLLDLASIHHETQYSRLFRS